MSIKVQIKELISKISKSSKADREIELELIDSLEKDCAEYLSSVTSMENAINIARFRLEASDFRDLVSNLDKQRSRKHNVLISTVKVLVRLCLLYNVQCPFTGDVNDRYQVAEFAKDYIDELWEERRL